MAAWLGLLRASVRAAAVRGAEAWRPRWLAGRYFSVSYDTHVNYEELKDLLKKEGVAFIDVREPWEIKEYGSIKGSMNIPLGELVSALQMTPKDFEEKYQKRLPEKSSILVFSCLAGIRSGKALDAATLLGYNRVYHYKGGFQDWIKHDVPEKQS